MPATRERTSASREPAVCAGYSNSTGTVAGFTSFTATTAGGMPPPPGGPFGAHAARASDAAMRRSARDGREGMARMGDFLLVLAAPLSRRAFDSVAGKGDNLHTNTD